MNSIERPASESIASLSWKDFSSRLKVLWEKEGAIKASLNLIDSHPAHKENVGRTGRRQILRAIGEDRLVSGDVIIPEPASTPVYEPIADRVMYCVYSTPVFNSNGYSTRTRGVAAGLKSAGADVVVVARAGYPWDWKVDTPMPVKDRNISVLDGISYVHLPNGAIDSLSPSAHIELAAEAFVQEALIQRPSYIQAASNYRVSLPALIAARRLGIPFVNEVRGLWEITGASNKPGFEATDRYAAMRDFESRVARAADHVFAITSQVKDELILRGVNEDKITLAPNAVDPEKFRPITPNAGMAVQFGLRPGVPIIGFAGSIVKYEGLKTLLEASRVLAERGVQHQIALAGSGNTEDSLISYAKTNKMEWVHFLGRIPQDKVPELLSASDIIVTPRDSTVITELVSALKPLEAFSAGRAVVLSDVAPNVDLAGLNGTRAKLFEAGNAESFADKLEELIKNPIERVHLARTAREWIETERNWPKIGANMFAQIKSIDGVSADLSQPSISLSDVRVGVIEGSGISRLLDDYVSVVPLSESGFVSDDVSDLDVMMLDLSRKNDLHHDSNGPEPEISKEIRKILVECGELGVPRVCLIPHGLSVKSFSPDCASLFDLCLTGEFEGVVEYLEDPKTSGLRVGYLPPTLKSSRFETGLELDNSIWVADQYGVTSTSFAGLLALVNEASDTLYETADVLEGDCTFNQVKTPVAVYIRRSTPQWVKRALISRFGLGTVLVWEARDKTTHWYGDTFVQGIGVLEFIAGIHHWLKNPEDRKSVVNHQVANLIGKHTIEVYLILALRGLGIPVAAIRSEDSSAAREIKVERPTSFGNEEFAEFLRDKSDDLAPVILRALRADY